MSQGYLLGGGKVEWSKIIMVDGTTGDDSTGERGRADKPFKTIQAAIDVYQENDLIDVLPSDYTITAGLQFAAGGIEKHINFRIGARVLGDFQDAIFKCPGTAATNNTVRVYGKGEFINSYIGANWIGSVISAGPCAFHGAKKIIGGQVGNGALGGSFLFGTTGNFAIYENIDEIVNWKTNGVAIAIATQDVDEEWEGRVFNCKKVGDNDNPCGVPISIAGQGTERTLHVLNSNFYSNGVLAHSIPQNACNLIVTDCVFKAVGNYAALIAKKGIYSNCHFSSNFNITTVNLQNQQWLTENPPLTPTFNNCTFVNTGTGTCVLSWTGAVWSGVNKFWAAGVNTANGFGVRLYNKNHGTIIANVINPTEIPQYFYFNILQDPPTVGEVYTITAPDGDTITYTVQPADTRTEVVDGLEAAWIAEAAATPAGFFAKFNNLGKLTAGIWRLQATALSAVDNLPPSTPFVLSTNGTDSVTTTSGEATQFPWKGTGKFIVDENLVVPNY